MTSFTPNDNFQYYLRYISERMNIFWRRFEGQQPPYSEDAIFAENKFTNVYRVLDRSSQYLVKNIINVKSQDGYEFTKEDMFWRIIIYKHFNLPSTWEYLNENLGMITVNTSVDDMVRLLDERAKQGKVLYSAAYMLVFTLMRNPDFLTEFNVAPGVGKHAVFLNIYRKKLFDDGVMAKVLGSENFEAALNNIRLIPSVGEFLSYQFIQDLNYSDIVDFDDNEICSAGGGTINGIHRTFDIEGKPDYNVIVKWVHANYGNLVTEYSSRFSVDFKARLIPGWGLKVPDLSNSFCETDKYMRQLGVQSGNIKNTRMKQKFKENPAKIEFMFPEKWGIKNL